MISKNIFDFLAELRENNYREWFHSHKEKYEMAKHEFEIFVNNTLPAVAKIDKTISALTAKDCIFRIFKDVRFAADKTPYKTNFGAYFVRGGKKGGYAGYYLHLEPGNSFLGGGIYMPPPDILKFIRREIFDNIDEFKKILAHKNFEKYFGAIEGEKLVLSPKGFPKDFPEIDLLKFKSYTVLHPLADKEILKKSFFDTMLNVFGAMYPMNEFLNRAIDDNR